VGDARFRIIGGDDSRYCAKVPEHVDMGADPRREVPGKARLGIGVVACTQRGNKEICRGDPVCDRIMDRDRISCIIDKTFFPRFVVLAAGDLECFQPCTVAETELTVLIALGVVLPVFMPEQLEGNTLSGKLLMDVLEGRHIPSCNRQGNGRGKKQIL